MPAGPGGPLPGRGEGRAFGSAGLRVSRLASLLQAAAVATRPAGPTAASAPPARCCAAPTRPNPRKPLPGKALRGFTKARAGVKQSRVHAPTC